MDEKRIAAIFKAFCDENRIRIIKLLRSGEKCACKLLEEINVTQPTLSHHMKILCDAEIVVGRKEGKWTQIGRASCRERVYNKMVDGVLKIRRAKMEEHRSGER